MKADQPRPASPRTARLINDRAAYELLLAHGPLTRAELGVRTGLSGPTVSELLTRLERAGIVAVAGAAEGARRGPRARLYAVVPDRTQVAGVAVSSKTIAAVIADVTGATVGSASVPMEPDTTSSRLVHRAVVRAAADAGVPADGLGRIVVGVPGLVDPVTGDLTFVRRLPHWGESLLPGLRDLFAPPVSLDNEVNLAGLAERHTGAAQGLDDFALLWLDEGVAAALVISGQLHRGRSGGAGEVSYSPLTDGGTVQDLVGESAILKQGRAFGWTGRTGATLVGRAVAAGAAGDAFLDDLADRVALAAAVTCTVLDPGAVVLAGGIGRAGGTALADRVAERINADLPLPTTVVPTEVTGNPVIGGTVHVALELLLKDTFQPA